jgi:hypothetical protein
MSSSVLLRAILVCLYFVTTQAAVAADVGFVEHHQCTFQITGEIVPGDYDAVVALGEDVFQPGGDRWGTYPEARACLHSPGGSFIEGLRIARYFFDRGIGTYIGDGDECYSVCAIMFMMGTLQWDERERADRILHVGGTLGFHRMFTILDDDRSYSSADLNMWFDLGVEGVYELLSLATLSPSWAAPEMIPLDLLRIIIQTPGDRFYYIQTLEDAMAWDIELDGVARRSQEDIRGASLGFACDNAILANGHQRDGARYGDVLSEEIFSFVGVYEQNLETIVDPISGYNSERQTYEVRNIRMGYYLFECGIRSDGDDVEVCGEFGPFELDVPSCDQTWMYTFTPEVLWHPSMRLSFLSAPEATLFDAARYVFCSKQEPGAALLDGVCTQLVIVEEVQGRPAVSQLLFFPDGSVTPLTVFGRPWDGRAEVRVDGRPAEQSSNSGYEECVVTSDRLRLCISG